MQTKQRRRSGSRAGARTSSKRYLSTLAQDALKWALQWTDNSFKGTLPSLECNWDRLQLISLWQRPWDIAGKEQKKNKNSLAWWWGGTLVCHGHFLLRWLSRMAQWSFTSDGHLFKICNSCPYLLVVIFLYVFLNIAGEGTICVSPLHFNINPHMSLASTGVN